MQLVYLANISVQCNKDNIPLTMSPLVANNKSCKDGVIVDRGVVGAIDADNVSTMLSKHLPLPMCLYHDGESVFCETRASRRRIVPSLEA